MTRVLLTPSEVESYERCPWMTYLVRHCGLTMPAVFENVLGLACHEFIRGLHAPKEVFCPPTKTIAPRFVPETMDEAWFHFWSDRLRMLKKDQVTRANLEDFARRGIELGPRYIGMYLKKRAVLALGPDKVEVSFGPIDIPGTSVSLKVKIDQIRPAHKRPESDVIVDLKFSRHNDFDPLQNFALRCYALVYRQEFERDEDHVCIWNIPHGKSGLKLATYTKADMESTANRLRRVSLAIANRKWDVPGGQSVCSTCEHKEMCLSPATSNELQRLAFRNNHHKGALPRSRIGIIRERVLELPDGKLPAEPYVQTELPLTPAASPR